MIRTLAYIILFFFVGTTMAQSVSDTVRISEIKVIGQRKASQIGLTISKPDSMAIRSAITSNLSELLAQNSPIFIKTYGRGSVATASFRGTAPSHTQLVWNGMALNSPMRGSADLSLLPVMFIDEAWLLHGGSSLSENSGALGGSIHLGNTADWLRTHLFSTVIERASFNSGTYLLRLQTGKNRFRSVTRLMYDHSDNNFPYFNVGVLPHRNDTLRNADFKKFALLQEFYQRFGTDNQFTFRIWTQVSDRNLPQLMSYEGTDRKENQTDEQLRLQLEVKNYSSKVKYHYSSGLNYLGLKYFRYFSSTGFVNDDANSYENSFYNRLKISSEVGENINLSASTELNYHSVNVHNVPRNVGYREDRFEAGVMFNLQFRLTENLGFTALNRAEYYDENFIPFVPSIGAEYLIPGFYPVFLRTNAARNYHKPSLNDLYWVPGGNPTLKPEDGIMADFSISAEGNDKFRQKLTLFYSKIDNWIQWQPAANGAWYWEAANVKEVLSRGIEYDISSRFKIKNIGVLINGNYAYTRSTNENAVDSADKSRGKQLIYIPKHTGNLHGTIIWNSWSVKGYLGYTGRRYTQSSNEWSHFESVLNPFWLTNASVEKMVHTGNWQITAKGKVENLFNINYQQILWRPMPGRHYSFTLAFKWEK